MQPAAPSSRHVTIFVGATGERVSISVHAPDRRGPCLAGAAVEPFATLGRVSAASFASEPAAVEPEAAAHGTPTVAFETGGIIDAVENLATGRLIPINQYHSFSEAVISMLQNSKNLTNGNCEAFAENFSWKKLKNRLNSLILDSKN